jgi:metal transporter CNNM
LISTNTDVFREIIDESDVYIDVHKAIRRMAPAPKARIQRAPPSAEVVSKAPEDNLIDLSESNGAPMVKSLTNSDLRVESHAVHFSTSPKTTFMRRASAGADGNPIQVRGNFNDMREHLKHLGPSNHASRPKTTRFNTVKIKSVQSTNRSDSRSESHGYQDSHGYRDSIDERIDPSTQGGEGEGLLRSAGMDAKDGVQAVQQGYGSFDRSSPSKQNQKGNNYVDGPPTETNVLGGKDGASDYVDGHQITKQNSQDSKKSDDTLASLPSSTRSQSFRRKTGVARSGSITENIIEAGGIRKVVLETNSSSDEQKEAGESNKGGSTSNFMALTSGADGNTSSVDGHEDNQGLANSGKKKRRRNRKKKPKTGGEDGSAVEGSTQG